MLNLRKYRQVIFDCDGVILNSNDVKSEAFSKSLAGESVELIQEFIDYHKNNGGVSRFVKFEHFFRNIKKQKHYKSDLNKALKKYSKLSLEGLLLSDEIDGVRSVLKFLNVLNIDCFVVSGGEQNEVRLALKSQGLSQYFKGVYGSPMTKQEHLLNIKPTESLYFGDAVSDYVAATVFDMDFVYISGASDWLGGTDFCRSKGVRVMEDFSKLII
jgi:beta-phosphoglucomutase-like phosphatase (HAD superfamily)